MKRTRVLMGAGALALVGWLGGCGGSGNPQGPSTPTPTPAPPAANITAAGNGSLVLHPSLDSRYGFALAAPIKITETSGGAASWDFARFQIYLSGKEVERYELGSSDIAAAGFHLVSAKSSNTYSVLYRQNSQNFDRVDITLGFTDQKDARSFTVPVPFSSFTDVTISLTPMVVPPTGTVRGGGR